ncbi:MAG: hydrolase [Treponema sp.]|jgi:predicted hydrolase (HD superfamily)|nr:hydrolase [Treponema sp.]
MNTSISRSQAWELLCKYNKDPFHLQHALTVEGVMKWYANDLGFAEDAEYWGIAGLLHDIDFEQHPNEHCLKAPKLLREGGVGEDLIHAVVSHCYGLTVDVAPVHQMEKVLFAADELTGLIWAVAIIRPSKSVQDMEVKSVKKKYKAANFAAGCSREVIERGVALLGWEIDTLIEKTILAMRSCEADVNAFMKSVAQRLNR